MGEEVMSYTNNKYCDIRIGIDGTTVTEETDGIVVATTHRPDDIYIEITDLNDRLCNVSVQAMVDAWFSVHRGMPKEPNSLTPRPVEPGQYGKVMIKEGWNELISMKQWIADVNYPGHTRRYHAFDSYVEASRWTEDVLLSMWLSSIDNKEEE
jgi:hypothetical protein